LGDCYFLAALSSLALKPERIQKIFSNTEYPASGTFMVNFYRKGYPVKVIVDDRLPLYPNPAGKYVDQLFNSKMSPNNAWWSVILEKAYCKMNVNCANINSGTALLSFYDLTGMPTMKHELEGMLNDDFYKIVSEATSKTWPMVASCVNGEYGL